MKRVLLTNNTVKGVITALKKNNEKSGHQMKKWPGI